MGLGKKLLGIATSMMIVTSPTASDSQEFCRVRVIDNPEAKTEDKVEEQRSADIVLRTGEYPNKPGKRGYIPDSYVPYMGVDVHKDTKGYYVCEYDINYKLCNRIYEILLDNGVSVEMLTSSGRGDDLNSAGRKAMSYNPKIYLSVHHNAWKEDSSGYFFMTNENSYEESVIAQRLSDSLVSNPGCIPQMKNRVNDGYIGELNETDDCMNILIEAGFFTNPDELIKITSDEQVEFMANQIARELMEVL